MCSLLYFYTIGTSKTICIRKLFNVTTKFFWIFYFTLPQFNSLFFRWLFMFCSSNRNRATTRWRISIGWYKSPCALCLWKLYGKKFKWMIHSFVLKIFEYGSVICSFEFLCITPRPHIQPPPPLGFTWN